MRSDSHYNGDGISETNIHKYYTSPLGGDMAIFALAGDVFSGDGSLLLPVSPV